MNILAKICVSIGLIFSSIFGLFHHGQNVVSTSTVATSTPQKVQVISQTSATIKAVPCKSSQGCEYNPYTSDGTNIYYQFKSQDPVIVTGADVATFSFIYGDKVYGDKGFDAQDKNHKYELGGMLCEDLSHQTCTESVFGPTVGVWYQN